MSQYVEGPTRSFEASGALAQHLRVYITGGQLAAADESTIEIGTLEREAFAADEVVSVRLRTAQGTCKMVASGDITAGNPVYAAASGKVAGTGTVYCGTALETTTANGDVFEVLRGPNTDLSAATTGTTATSFTVDSDGNTAKIALSTNSATGDFTATIVPPNLSADATITTPATTGTLATLAGTETFTNKTLTSPALTSPVMTTPQINDTTADHQYVVAVSELAADRTVTLPLLLGNDTFVFADFIQTLTNKTLTTPTITSPVMTLATAAINAAGADQTNAAALTVSAVNVVGAADATKCVMLPAAAAGKWAVVYSTAATVGLPVFPNLGDDINGGTANASVTIEARSPALFICADANTWTAIYTANS